SRDLFEVAEGSNLDVLDIGADEFLYVVSFEGLDGAEADKEFDAVRRLRSGVTWFNAVGLDKASRYVGLRKLTRLDADLMPLPPESGASETIFVPISRFANSPSAALAQAPL